MMVAAGGDAHDDDDMTHHVEGGDEAQQVEHELPACSSDAMGITAAVAACVREGSAGVTPRTCVGCRPDRPPPPVSASSRLLARFRRALSASSARSLLTSSKCTACRCSLLTPHTYRMRMRMRACMHAAGLPWICLMVMMGIYGGGSGGGFYFQEGFIESKN